MIGVSVRDWITLFAMASWSASVTEAFTARSICSGSFARKVPLFDTDQKRPAGRDTETQQATTIKLR